MNTSLFNQTLANVVTALNNTTLASAVGTKQKADPDQWRQTAPWSGNWTEQQQHDSYVFGVVCYPILLAFCTIGNGLNLVVLASEKRKTTTNCYMTAVAVADLVLLWFALPLYLWNTASSFQLPYRTVYYNTTRATTYAVLPYMAWGQEWSLEFCDWVLIVFSIERLLAVIRPFGFKWLQRPLTARIIIIILFVLAAMFAVCNFPYWLEINRVKDGKRTRKYWPKYLKEWYPIQEMAELIMCLSKFFGLLLINLILIAAIKRQQNSEIGKMRAAQRANSDKKYRNSNVLLLSSVALYLISWFPSVVYKCMEISDIYHMYNFDYTAKMVATAPCQIMSFLYYSVNFFLYLTVSKKYRMEFARIFAPIFCPSWAKKHWKSMSDSINTTVRPNRSKAAGVPSSATSVAKNGKPGGGTGGKQEVGKTVSTATVISLHDSGKEKTALTPVSTIKESVT